MDLGKLSLSFGYPVIVTINKTFQIWSASGRGAPLTPSVPTAHGAVGFFRSAKTSVWLGWARWSICLTVNTLIEGLMFVYPFY